MFSGAQCSAPYSTCSECLSVKSIPVHLGWKNIVERLFGDKVHDQYNENLALMNGSGGLSRLSRPPRSQPGSQRHFVRINLNKLKLHKRQLLPSHITERRQQCITLFLSINVLTRRARSDTEWIPNTNNGPHPMSYIPYLFLLRRRRPLANYYNSLLRFYIHRIITHMTTAKSVSLRMMQFVIYSNGCSFISKTRSKHDDFLAQGISWLSNGFSLSYST